MNIIVQAIMLIFYIRWLYGIHIFLPNYYLFYIFYIELREVILRISPTTFYLARMTSFGTDVVLTHEKYDKRTSYTKIKKCQVEIFDVRLFYVHVGGIQCVG